MKKFLMIILSLLLLVGCSNEVIDDSSSEVIDSSYEEVEDSSSNELAEINVGTFGERYIPEAHYTVGREYIGEFEAKFGDDDSILKGCDETYKGIIEFTLDIRSEADMNEGDYYLDGLARYVSDIVGSDVSGEIKDTFYSNYENCKSRYLSGEPHVYEDGTSREDYAEVRSVIMEHDLFTIESDISICEYDGSVMTHCQLSLIPKE